MTYRELIYIVLDELKSISDDSFFTEEHVVFLANKYRATILKQRYSDIKKPIPESNYQTICLNLKIDETTSNICDATTYLKSIEKVPYLMKLGNPTVYPVNYYLGDIAYISRDRMRYVGYNRYLNNVIYSSLGPDNYLYFRSANPQALHLEQVQMTGIFEDPQEAAKLQCDSDDASCDIFDAKFPLEEGLVPVITELIIKELLAAEYRPKDDVNNANDDISDIINWARHNMKSGLQKQIEGQ